MHLIVHLLFGVIFGFILNLPYPMFILFVVASIAIDFDHFLEWKKASKKVKTKLLLNPIEYSKKVNYKTLQQSLHFFHTFEILALILILGIWNDYFQVIGIAFCIHFALDIIGNIWNRNIMQIGEKGWLKYLFLTFYIIKRDLYNKENIK